MFKEDKQKCTNKEQSHSIQLWDFLIGLTTSQIYITICIKHINLLVVEEYFLLATNKEKSPHNLLEDIKN